MDGKVATLAELGLTAQGGREARLTGLSVDSREVRPGHLFAALPGSVSHGAGFVETALEGGAAAILTDADGARIVAAIEEMQKVSVDFSGLDVSTVALAWLMRHSANIAPVVGTTKVERIALQNAASIAGLLLTTDAVVTEIKEKKKEAAGAPGMDDMDY